MVTRTAGTTSELTTAFNASSGGDIIELDAGAVFGPSQYAVPNGSDYTGSPVIVRSADSGDPATFNDFNINAASRGNITFEDITFQAVSGVALTFAIVFVNSSNITFDGCRFLGVPISGTSFPSARGIEARTTDSITVQNSLFSGLQDGYFGFDGSDHNILDNEFVGLGSDGQQFAGVYTVNVLRNYLHDWVQPQTGHIDVIQLLHTNTKGGCQDVTYEENIADQANGKFQQGFWCGRDGFDTSQEINRHQRVIIRNNLFITGHVNGFGLDGITDITIEKNTHIVGPSGVTNSAPLWNFADVSGTVIVRDNIFPGYNNSPPGGATVSNNYAVVRTDFGTIITLLKEGASDGYHDIEVPDAQATAGGVDAGSRLTKRVGGWSDAGIVPHPDYAALPAGFVGGATAPTLSSTVPADNAVDIALGAVFTATFSKTLQFGTGNITLRENDGGWADLEVFDVTTDTGTSAGDVNISGTTLTIRPTAALVAGREYAIRIDATAIDDNETSPLSFAGIADDTTWSFTAVSSVPAVPANGQITLAITVA